jgi:hypothetical protein
MNSKRPRTSDAVDTLSSSIQTLSAQLLLTDAAVRRLKDVHSKEMSDANRQFSVLLRGKASSTSTEQFHQMELRCIRLEGENAALKSVRERDGSRLKELEAAEAVRQHAWAGLNPSEICLIMQYERKEFEASPAACVQRRLELQYSREAVEQTRKACSEQIRRADEQLKDVSQSNERVLAAEAKASHMEQKWALLRGQVYESEAEAARARKDLAECTKEMLSVMEGSRVAQGQNKALKAEAESTRSEIAQLRTEGAEAVARKEYAERTQRMVAEHKAELDGLRAAMHAKISEMKRRRC